ncbi:transcriptional regulator, MarR family [Lachnospiraceae bacterium KM106-2]|nr:transcriptional regulator, MarR family [Lachnospiraceae bacterium KM106-2]
MKENPGRLISILYRKSQMFWCQLLKEYEVSAAEYPVLMILYRQDGRTQENVVSELAIDKSAITRVVKSLEEKGFIERKKDEVDKRCNRIYLTEKGHLLKKPIEKGIMEWNGILQKDMSNEESDEVMRLLNQMVDNIQEQSEKKEKRKDQ